MKTYLDAVLSGSALLAQTCLSDIFVINTVGFSDGKITTLFSDHVEMIKLEIKNVANAMSMGPIVDGDRPVEIRPGQYEVR